jgi:hypothetical protein
MPGKNEMKHADILALRDDILSGARKPTIADTVSVIDAYFALHGVALKMDAAIHTMVKQLEKA